MWEGEEKSEPVAASVNEGADDEGEALGEVLSESIPGVGVAPPVPLADSVSLVVPAIVAEPLEDGVSQKEAAALRLPAAALADASGEFDGDGEAGKVAVCTTEGEGLWEEDAWGDAVAEGVEEAVGQAVGEDAPAPEGVAAPLPQALIDAAGDADGRRESAAEGEPLADAVALADALWEPLPPPVPDAETHGDGAPLALAVAHPLPLKEVLCEAVARAVGEAPLVPVTVGVALPSAPDADAAPDALALPVGLLDALADGDARAVEDAGPVSEPASVADPLVVPHTDGALVGLAAFVGETAAVGEALAVPQREGGAEGLPAAPLPDGRAEAEPLALGDPQTLSRPLALGEREWGPEALAQDEALPLRLSRPLADAQGVLLGQGLALRHALPEAEAQPEGVPQEVGAGLGDAAPLAEAQGDSGALTEGLGETEGETDALADPEGEPVPQPLWEAVPLPEALAQPDADPEAAALALRDALPLPLSHALPPPLGEPRALAEREGLPTGLTVCEGGGEGLVRALADTEADRDADAEPQRVAPTEALPAPGLREGAAVLSADALAAEAVGGAEGGGDAEAREKLGLAVPASLLLGSAEKEADAEARALRVSREPLAEAVADGQGDDERDGDSRAVLEAERDTDSVAEGLAVPAPERVAERVKDGLGEPLSERGGVREGDAQAVPRRVADAHAVPLADCDGEREARALAVADTEGVPLRVAVSQAETLAEREGESVPDGLPVAEADARGEALAKGLRENCVADSVGVRGADKEAVGEAEAQPLAGGVPDPLAVAQPLPEAHEGVPEKEPPPLPLAVALSHRLPPPDALGEPLALAEALSVAGREAVAADAVCDAEVVTVLVLHKLALGDHVGATRVLRGDAEALRVTPLVVALSEAVAEPRRERVSVAEGENESLIAADCEAEEDGEAQSLSDAEGETVSGGEALSLADARVDAEGSRTVADTVRVTDAGRERVAERDTAADLERETQLLPVRCECVADKVAPPLAQREGELVARAEAESDCGRDAEKEALPVPDTD